MVAPAPVPSSPSSVRDPLGPRSSSPDHAASTPASSVAAATVSPAPRPRAVRSRASAPASRRRNTHTGHPTWDAHRSALKMLQDEVRVLGIMRPSPAPPEANMQHVQYEPAPVSGRPRPHSVHNPPFASTAGVHRSNRDLVHSLSVLAEQGRSDPSVQQRSWRGMVFPDAGFVPASPDTELHPDAQGATPAPSRSSPRPIPSLARSYTEGCMASPPTSPWSKFRHRLGSLSQSHIPEKEEDHPVPFTGSGWGGAHHRNRRASVSMSGDDDSGFSGSGWQALPPDQRHYSRRRSVSEAAGSSSRSPSTSGFARVHRQATLPIDGAPGFSPHDHSTFGGAAAAAWAAEELAQGAQRKKNIPVELVGRASDGAGGEARPSNSPASEAVRTGVITPELAARLQAQLPPRLRLGTKWQLVYSLDQHGVSLKTMYALAGKFFHAQTVRDTPEQAPGPFALLDKELSSKLNVSADTTEPSATPSSASGRPRPKRHGTEPCYSSTGSGHAGTSPRHRHHHLGAVADQSRAGLVLAIRDMDGNVFGAFLQARLHVAPHYYGSGECFLWKVASAVPSGSGPAPSVGQEGQQDEFQPGRRLVVYRWTGQNDFVILSEAHFLSVGYGTSSTSQGGYGLWVDDEFARGSSARCATFNNDVLCSPDAPTRPPRSGGREEAYFECFQVELWAVGLSS